MTDSGKSRTVLNPIERTLSATVELGAAPERVFRALTSTEITQWWVRPGVFDTREWSGALRVNGHWRAAGVGMGRPYALEGEFSEVDPPWKLVHSWHPVGSPAKPSTVTYLLEPVDRGTRLTVGHSGFSSAGECSNAAMGWETSLETLAGYLLEHENRETTTIPGANLDR